MTIRKKPASADITMRVNIITKANIIMRANITTKTNIIMRANITMKTNTITKANITIMRNIPMNVSIITRANTITIMEKNVAAGRSMDIITTIMQMKYLLAGEKKHLINTKKKIWKRFCRYWQMKPGMARFFGQKELYQIQKEIGYTLIWYQENMKSAKVQPTIQDGFV